VDSGSSAGKMAISGNNEWWHVNFYRNHSGLVSDKHQVHTLQVASSK